METRNLDREHFKWYKDNYSNTIPREDYLRILSLFMKFIVRKILVGQYFRLPYGLGELCIEGWKVRYKFDKTGKMISAVPINWKRTKELNKVIYHENQYTDGIIYRWKWKRLWRSTLKNIKYFSFKVARQNRLDLSKQITEHNFEYPVIETNNRKSWKVLNIQQ